MKNPELLHTASEQFLGKKEHEIKSTVLQTLEGHLRAILGTLTVEEVYKDRDQFASLVREVAAPDVGRMGIEILSFTIKDVYDNVTYLQSLGKAQTAAVKRDAEIGVAQVSVLVLSKYRMSQKCSHGYQFDRFNKEILFGTPCRSWSLLYP